MLQQSDWQPHGPGGARAPSLPVADLMISDLGGSTFLDLIRKSPDFIRAYKGKEVWSASKGISGGIESPDISLSLSHWPICCGTGGEERPKGLWGSRDSTNGITT